MAIRKIILGLLIAGMMGCNSVKEENNSTISDGPSDVKIIGAMKNVMWKGELGGNIDLDTISDKSGLYGLGPVSYLTGELLINNGRCYVSKVASDSSIIVEKRFDVSAPFFVYANVTQWSEVELGPEIKTIRELEKVIEGRTTALNRPFAFKLIGKVSNARIHIQNLPVGTKVSSPEEAHQGQINYQLFDEEAEIIGFFSKEHKGVFTHHDSFLHMHLITKDERKMGHLDELEIEKMVLYLPKN